MPEHMQVDGSPSLSSLVGGIINDAQTLIRQEMTLARREIQEEFGKTKMAAVSLGTGVAIVSLGVLLMCLMLVHLLNWISNGNLPLWVCYGIVGGLFLAIGGVLLYAGKNKMTSINLMPRQTVDSMKENVQWIKSQT